MVFLSYLWSEAKFSDMDKVQKQRGSIVLHKETRDGADYIRIEYANSQAVALLLAQDTGMEMAGNGSAYIASAAFSLPDFYDRYSPHAYIDYSRVYVRHPKPKREYTLPKGYLELLEQKRYSPSTVKTYRAYFSDFMEYHKVLLAKLNESVGYFYIHLLSPVRECIILLCTGVEQPARGHKASHRQAAFPDNQLAGIRVHPVVSTFP